MIKVEFIERKIKRRFCDFCDGEKDVRNCSYCKKDFCTKCGTYYFEDSLTGEGGGDYLFSVCNTCYKEIKPFSERYKKEQKKAEDILEKIEQEWISYVEENLKGNKSNV